MAQFCSQGVFVDFLCSIGIWLNFFNNIFGPIGEWMKDWGIFLAGVGALWFAWKAYNATS